jgi:hypothetical protein
MDDLTSRVCKGSSYGIEALEESANPKVCGASWQNLSTRVGNINARVLSARSDVQDWWRNSANPLTFNNSVASS